MVQPIVQPKDRLTPQDIKDIPLTERGKYVEAYLSTLIHANKERGLAPTEIENLTGFPKNTLYKYLELLFSKGEIYRVKRGRAIIFYPNGRIFHPLHERDMVFDNKKYRISLIENPDGRHVYLQEKDIDENGFEDVVRGIMLPYEHLDKIITKLTQLKSLNLKLED
jgi:hypothetical protein